MDEGFFLSEGYMTDSDVWDRLMNYEEVGLPNFARLPKKWRDYIREFGTELKEIKTLLLELGTMKFKVFAEAFDETLHGLSEKTERLKNYGKSLEREIMTLNAQIKEAEKVKDSVFLELIACLDLERSEEPYRFQKRLEEQQEQFEEVKRLSMKALIGFLQNSVEGTMTKYDIYRKHVSLNIDRLKDLREILKNLEIDTTKYHDDLYKCVNEKAITGEIPEPELDAVIADLDDLEAKLKDQFNAMGRTTDRAAEIMTKAVETNGKMNSGILNQWRSTIRRGAAKENKRMNQETSSSSSSSSIGVTKKDLQKLNEGMGEATEIVESYFGGVVPETRTQRHLQEGRRRPVVREYAGEDEHEEKEKYTFLF